MAKSAARQHPLATISDTGSTPIQPQAIIQQMAPALQAKGLALASTILAEASNQASIWGRFYRDLLELSPEGRKSFRSAITAATKRHRGDSDSLEHVGTLNKDGTVAEYDDRSEATRRSARVRLSEFMTITKALDAGIEFEKGWAFHYAVGHARTALKATASGGDKRGRKAKPAVEKMKEYILKHADEIGGLDKVEELVHELANQPETAA
jgi:hypothetical protein